MKIPKCVALCIEYQPQALDYNTVDAWLADAKARDLVTVLDQDASEMSRTGTVWLIRWYPHTPIGWCAVAAATLERALALAMED